LNAQVSSFLGREIRLPRDQRQRNLPRARACDPEQRRRKRGVIQSDPGLALDDPDRASSIDFEAGVLRRDLDLWQHILQLASELLRSNLDQETGLGGQARLENAQQLPFAQRSDDFPLVQEAYRLR